MKNKKEQKPKVVLRQSSESENIMNTLLKHEADVIDPGVKETMLSNGWFSNDFMRRNCPNTMDENDRNLYYANSAEFAGFIPGVSFICNESFTHVLPVTSMMVNTLDDGFHYAAPSKDRNSTLDLGPVHEPVIVGNANNPSGIYIPFNDLHAMKSGMLFLGAYIDSAQKPEFKDDFVDNIANAFGAIESSSRIEDHSSESFDTNGCDNDGDCGIHVHTSNEYRWY